MRILYVNDFDYLGGAEIVMHQLAEHMKNKGHEVYFAFAHVAKEKERCFKIPYMKRRKLFGRFVPFWNIKDPKVYKATRKIIGKIKPDLVHFHKFELLTLAPLIAAKRCNISRLITVHDAILICLTHYRLKPNEENCMETGWNNCASLCLRQKYHIPWLLRYEMRKRYKILQNELLVTPCDYLRKLYRNFGWQGKILTIPNGVETQVFKPNYSSSETVIWAGRVSREKGPEYFVRAAEVVKKKYQKARFLMIGSTTDKRTKTFKSWAVERIEWMSREQLIEHYRKSLMLVMTSLYETSPLVVLEAMACGKPVIAFAVGGLKEIVSDGENGFLVKPKNYEELAEKILLLLTDQNLALKLGKRAREKVERDYRIENTVRNYEEQYKEISK